jgi:hypothetical protein
VPTVSLRDLRIAALNGGPSHKRFERVFSIRTGYQELFGMPFPPQGQLLRELERPEIPLHCVSGGNQPNE